MFAGHLANALEVLGRQFRGKLPGGFPAAGLRHENAVFRNQDRSVLQVARAKRETGVLVQTVTRLSKARASCSGAYSNGTTMPRLASPAARDCQACAPVTVVPLSSANGDTGPTIAT